MQSKKTGIGAQLFFWALVILYNWYLFRTIWKIPGHCLLSDGGDGAKNYYNYLYHVLNGKGWMTQGMNYPWGEHAAFTDNQPLLAVPLSYLRETLHLNLNDALAWMNLLIPIGFILSAYFLFRLFGVLKINPFLAAVGALFLVSLAPNTYRMFGHFGLSYTFHISGTLWFIFAYRRNPKWYLLLALLFLSASSGLLHLYNLAVLIFLSTFIVFAGLLLDDGNIRQRMKCWLPILISVLMGFVLIKSLFAWTDPIHDRPRTPWGTVNYVSTINDILTSSVSYLGKTFLPLTGEKEPAGLGEGYGYIGVIPIFYIIYFFILLVYRQYRKKEQKWTSTLKEEKILVFSGILGLFLAMGIPFIWGMEGLLEYTGPFRQFRSLGRMSIIFYFLIGIACIIGMNRWLEDLKERKAAFSEYLLIFAVLFLWSNEILSYSFSVQRECDQAPNHYNDFFSRRSEEEEIPTFSKQEYQCILALPMFCIGSEKSGKEPELNMPERLYKISLKNSIPIVNKLLSRSSWSQEFQLMRIGGLFSDKSDFVLPDQRPILLLSYGEFDAQSGEAAMIRQARFLQYFEGFEIYSLNWNQYLQAEKQQKDSLRNSGAWASKPDFYLSDTNSNEMLGQGGFNISGKDSLLIYDGKNPLNQGTYECSFWARVNALDYRMPFGKIMIWNQAGEKIRQEEFTFRTSKSNQNFWFRFHTHLDIDSNVQKVQIWVMNDGGKAADRVNEFQIRAQQQPSLMRKGNQVSYNNFIF